MFTAYRARAAATLFCFLLFACVAAPAVAAPRDARQVTIRNEEKCAAKVALLYKTRQAGWKVTGWFVFGPDPAVQAVPLPDLADNDIYACVIFADPKIVQFVDSDGNTKKAFITDNDFSYRVGSETPVGENLREAVFFKPGAPYGEDAPVWLNLSEAAG